jgi:hypothetical protein
MAGSEILWERLTTGTGKVLWADQTRPSFVPVESLGIVLDAEIGLSIPVISKSHGNDPKLI